MEITKIVRNQGSDSGPQHSNSDRSSALKELDRKAMRLHGRHLLAWLFRVALFAGIITATISFVVHPLGAVLSVISAYMLYRSVLFAVKGHRKIAKYRKAKRYWLKTEGIPPDIMAAEVVAEAELPLGLKKAV